MNTKGELVRKTPPKVEITEQEPHRATDRDAVEVYIASLAQGSRRAVTVRLRNVAAFLRDGEGDIFRSPWSQLRYEHLTAIKTGLLDGGMSPSTVNLHLYAVRGVLRAAANLGLVSSEQFFRVNQVKPVRGEKVPAGRELTLGEIAALISACQDGTPSGIRDAALFAVLYAAGLRRAEAVALKLDDFSGEEGRLLVRGKGNKERTVFLSNGALDAVRDWIDVRGSAPGPLFCRVGKGKNGTVTIAMLSTNAIFRVLERRAKKAGVRSFSPHDCRRSCVSHLLANGVDISTVSRFVGHSSVNITARYDRRGDESKKRASETLHIPYLRKEEA